MAVASAPSTQLGCGRDIDQVWARLDRAPDAHELTCPYCQVARADLENLARATRQLREDDATNPDQQLSSGVLDRILAVARAEVRRGRRLPLDQPDLDGTSPNTVSEQAVTAVVRRVGDRTRNIEIRRCSITRSTTSSASATRPDPDQATRSEHGPDAPIEGSDRGARDTGPATVSISLRVSVAHGLAIADAGNQLRDAVISAVEQEVGVRVSSVDISVEDLHDA